MFINLHLNLEPIYKDRTLTILRLPPCYETVGSEGCDHVVDGVAVGMCDLIVEFSRVTLKTHFGLQVNREKPSGIRVKECVHQMFWSAPGTISLTHILTRSYTHCKCGSDDTTASV